MGLTPLQRCSRRILQSQPTVLIKMGQYFPFKFPDRIIEIQTEKNYLLPACFVAENEVSLSFQIQKYISQVGDVTC